MSKDDNFLMQKNPTTGLPQAGKTRKSHGM